MKLVLSLSCFLVLLDVYVAAQVCPQSGFEPLEQDTRDAIVSNLIPDKKRNLDRRYPANDVGISRRFEIEKEIPKELPKAVFPDWLIQALRNMPTPLDPDIMERFGANVCRVAVSCVVGRERANENWSPGAWTKEGYDALKTFMIGFPLLGGTGLTLIILAAYFGFLNIFTQSRHLDAKLHRKILHASLKEDEKKETIDKEVKKRDTTFEKLPAHDSGKLEFASRTKPKMSRRDMPVDDICSAEGDSGKNLDKLIWEILDQAVFPKMKTDKTSRVLFSLYHPTDGPGDQQISDGGSLQVLVDISDKAMTWEEADKIFESASGSGVVDLAEKPLEPKLEDQSCYTGARAGLAEGRMDPFLNSFDMSKQFYDECMKQSHVKKHRNVLGGGKDIGPITVGSFEGHLINDCAEDAEPIPCSDLFGRNGDGVSGDIDNNIRTCGKRQGNYYGGIISHIREGEAEPCAHIKIDPLPGQ
ncbi:MAG: hypothetical protein M1837_003580 [Sclerophora amabilis]|nr:MAG: hypothetical protein M1837_003580 [Sclerophora amabilis]